MKPARLKLRPYRIRQQNLCCADGFEMPVTVVGQGRPVLLVHAFGMDARQFLPFILPLAQQFCFYLPHLRGFGLSAETPSSQFDFIEQYADDISLLLEDICQRHQTNAIDVGGISMGALVMWAYFNRFMVNHSTSISRLNKYDTEYDPQDYTDSQNNLEDKPQPATPFRVKRYLNIDQSPIVHNQPDWQGGVFGDRQEALFSKFSEIMSEVFPYIRDQNITEFSHLPYKLKRQITEMETAFSLLSVARWPSRWLVNSLGYQAPHKLALYEHKTWRQKLHALHAYLTLPYDYRQALNTDIPVHLLIGGQSKLYDPVWQRKLADILPDAYITEIPQSGHAIPLDAPRQFTRALKQFLLAGSND